MHKKHVNRDSHTASSAISQISFFDNSTLRYECDETLSDECEFAARAEGE